jgi:site-specific recombinase XerD
MKQTRHARAKIQLHDTRREAATAAGLGSVGWHTFRHTYRALLSDGTPLEVQQKLLRHADIRTTIGYGDVSMENKRAANTRVVRSILIRKAAK